MSVVSNGSISFFASRTSESQLQTSLRLDESGARLLADHIQIVDLSGRTLFHAQPNHTEFHTDAIRLQSKSASELPSSP